MNSPQDEHIRNHVLESLPASSKSQRRIDTIKNGEMRLHRDGNKLYAYFITEGFRILAIV